MRQPTPAERELLRQVRENAEKQQVAAQPHRNGNMSKMAGSELGRFILSNITAEKCLRENSNISIDEYRGEVMDACESYARRRYQWCRVKGVPLPGNFAWDVSFQNGEKLQERVEEWEKFIHDCEAAMKQAGMVGFVNARSLIMDDTPVPLGCAHDVRLSLQSLHAKMWEKSLDATATLDNKLGLQK
jgi:hypothetical protein